MGFNSPLADYEVWGPDRRDYPFFPTRLILDWQERSSSRQTKRLDDVRPLLNEATENLRGLLIEAREYFQLGAGEPLRIGCAGCRTTLFAHDLANDPLIDQAAAPLKRKGSAHYCAQLALALQDLGLVELQWLGDGFPEASAALASADLHEARPTRLGWLARRIRRQLAHDPRLAGAAGSISLFFYKKWGLWRRYPVTDASTEQLLGQVMADLPKARSGVLAVLVARPQDSSGCLDNPILTKGELELAAMAGVKIVLLDARHGLLFDRDLGVPSKLPKSPRKGARPPPSEPKREIPPLPPVYPL